MSGHQPTIEQVGTVYQLDAAAIELRGARSLDDALELLPGVNVHTGGNGSPRIDVRGYRTGPADCALVRRLKAQDTTQDETMCRPAPTTFPPAVQDSPLAASSRGVAP